jgi:tetratricopeptide (TPR) repeat protein
MREMGRTLPLAHSSQQIGQLELLSGNAAEAERILGDAVRVLDATNSDALGIVSAFRAQALYALGRLEDADLAASKGISDRSYDVAQKVMGLGVRAMVAAHGGRFEEAERTARRAIAIIDETDFPCDRADARVALAEVLELAGRREEAAAAVAVALDLFETKGNVLQAGQTRARLERLTS